MELYDRHHTARVSALIYQNHSALQAVTNTSAKIPYTLNLLV